MYGVKSIEGTSFLDSAYGMPRNLCQSSKNKAVGFLHHPHEEPRAPAQPLIPLLPNWSSWPFHMKGSKTGSSGGNRMDLVYHSKG